MKEWFKYENGYVNIDTESIYFTNTGNWSEAKTLKEKGIQKSNAFRKGRMQLFVITSLILFALIFIKNISGGNASLLILLGLPFAGFYLYKNFKLELGYKFKVPLEKIENITINSSDAIIVFNDSFNNRSEVNLKGLNKVGLDILLRLTKVIHAN